MKAAPCLTRCRRQALPAHAAHFMRPKALPETVSMGRRAYVNGNLFRFYKRKILRDKQKKTLPNARAASRDTKRGGYY